MVTQRIPPTTSEKKHQQIIGLLVLIIGICAVALPFLLGMGFMMLWQYRCVG